MSPDLSTTTTTADVIVADEREAFCREHLVILAKALGLFVRDAALGEELAQEALLRACARWPQVRALDSPRAWLYRVGINVARSRARRLVIGARALARHGATITIVEHDHDEALDVRRALAALPDGQQRVTVLRHLAGLSVAETASVLGLSEGAVKTRDHRARAAMRAALTEETT